MGGRHDRFEQDFALLQAELLGIVEAGRDIIGVEDHRSGDHRTCERPAACLVGSGNRPVSGIASGKLQAEITGEGGIEKHRRIGRRVNQHGGRLARRPDLLQAPKASAASLSTALMAVGSGQCSRRGKGAETLPRTKLNMSGLTGGA
ncbi:hypothetical protein D3C73_588850 [compost metagenome]